MPRTIKAADLFCGAGGTSTGLAHACEELGLKLQLTAVNHWPVAIETHSTNHPDAVHFCASLDHLRPSDAVPGGKLDVLLASPECTHHARARGGKPINDQSRASAWHVVRWAEELRPRAILVENVPEFTTWGPLDAKGRPIKRLRGQIFLSFVSALRALGYTVDWRVLNAADYGDPTTRRRLILQARLGRKITWPEPTHAPDENTCFAEGRAKWRPARSVIDWNRRGRSIFNRKKPLAASTMARIEVGIRKFWGKEAEPFLVILRQHMDARSIDDPIPSLCANGQHVGLVEPFITKFYGSGNGVVSVNDPLPTVTTKDRFGLVEHQGCDILFRMLAPYELAGAMGFPADYKFVGVQSDQVKQVGNAVPVKLARSLCREVLHA